MCVHNLKLGVVIHRKHPFYSDVSPSLGGDIRSCSGTAPVARACTSTTLSRAQGPQGGGAKPSRNRPAYKGCR